MTETQQIADVVVAAVRAATSPMSGDMAAMMGRLAALEANHTAMGDQMAACQADIADCLGQVKTLAATIDALPMPKDGKDGADGINGVDGRNGSDAAVGPLVADLATLVARAQAIEGRLDRIGSADLSDEDLAAQCEDLTRKAFGELPAPVPVRRMQKRVIRDGDGRIERVVEEPVGP